MCRRCNIIFEKWNLQVTFPTRYKVCMYVRMHMYVTTMCIHSMHHVSHVPRVECTHVTSSLACNKYLRILSASN